MPYPLPSDTAGVSGITWKLIAVPDDPAYTRAALDRYSAISDVWNWGMEGVESDSYLARQQWLTAVLLTLELWDMNPLETIIGHIDEIETLLAQMGESACCYDMDPTDGDTYTDTGFGDSGPFPQELVDAGYLTDTSDTAGWLDYKCMISNAFVDAIIAWLNKMAPLVDGAGLLIGGLAVLASILSFVAFPVAGTAAYITFRILMGAGAVATVWRYLAQGSSYGLTTIADELETNREDLVCALYQGDGVGGSLAAFREAVRDLWPFPVDELIVALGDSTVFKSFYGGRYDQEDVAAQFEDKGYAGSFDCDNCEDPPTPLNWQIDSIYGQNFDPTPPLYFTVNAADIEVDSQGANSCNWVHLLIEDMSGNGWWGDITVESDVSGTNCINPFKYYVTTRGGTILYQSNTPPSAVSGQVLMITTSAPYRASIQFRNVRTTE